MTDPLDDQIRDALRAETDCVRADDDLLDRIRASAAATPLWRRRMPLLVTAAALAAVVGLAAALLVQGDERSQLDAIDDPTGATLDSPSTSLPGEDGPSLPTISCPRTRRVATSSSTWTRWRRAVTSPRWRIA